MTQVAVPVQTNARVSIYLQPKPSIQSRRGLRVANGVLDVESGDPLHLIIANFTKNSHSFPKRAVVAYATQNLLALLLPDEETARSVSTVLQIPGTPSAAEASAADQDFSSDKFLPQVETQSLLLKTEKAATGAWRGQVDPYHIEWGKTRTRIQDMLALHVSMSNGELWAMHAMGHRVDLGEGIHAVHFLPYRQGPAMNSLVKVELKKQLEAGVLSQPLASKHLLWCLY